MFTEANGVKSEWFFAMGHKLKQNSITNDIMSSNQHWYIATHTILYGVCLVDHFSTLPTLPVATPLVSLACQSGRLPTPNLSASKTRLPSNRTLSSWKTRYWTSGNHAELRITHGWVSASYNINIYIYISLFSIFYLWWDSPRPPKRLDAGLQNDSFPVLTPRRVPLFLLGMAKRLNTTNTTQESQFQSQHPKELPKAKKQLKTRYLHQIWK